MAENKMAQVAELLGVKLGEVFTVTWGSYKERLTEEGLEYQYTNGDWSYDSDGLIYLLTGKCEIIKKPWKPVEGDRYYYIATSGNITFCNWHCDVTDLNHYAVGNCFLTKEEALAHRQELLEKWKAKYEED